MNPIFNEQEVVTLLHFVEEYSNIHKKILNLEEELAKMIDYQNELSNLLEKNRKNEIDFFEKKSISSNTNIEILKTEAISIIQKHGKQSI